MTKDEAIKLFGTGSALARAIGVSPQAIYQWPPVLTRALEDRVLAAIARSEAVGRKRIAAINTDRGAA